jgi:hypothetical protein
VEVIVILNDVGRCQYTCIVKFSIMIYWHYFRIIRFYLFNVTCIVLYIFGPVATHGHAPSSFKRNKLTSRIGLQNFLFLRDLPFQFVQPPRSNR